MCGLVRTKTLTRIINRFFTVGSAQVTRRLRIASLSTSGSCIDSDNDGKLAAEEERLVVREPEAHSPREVRDVLEAGLLRVQVLALLRQRAVGEDAVVEVPLPERFPGLPPQTVPSNRSALKSGPNRSPTSSGLCLRYGLQEFSCGAFLVAE